MYVYIKLTCSLYELTHDEDLLLGDSLFVFGELLRFARVRPGDLFATSQRLRNASMKMRLLDPFLFSGLWSCRTHPDKMQIRLCQRHGLSAGAQVWELEGEAPDLTR